MPGGLDDLSRAIGRIEAMVEANSKVIVGLDTKLDTMHDRMNVVEQFGPRLDVIEPLAKDYETNRNRAIGVWFTLTIIVGAISAKVTAFASTFFGSSPR